MTGYNLYMQNRTFKLSHDTLEKMCVRKNHSKKILEVQVRAHTRITELKFLTYF